MLHCSLKDVALDRRRTVYRVLCLLALPSVQHPVLRKRRSLALVNAYLTLSSTLRLIIFSKKGLTVQDFYLKSSIVLNTNNQVPRVPLQLTSALWIGNCLPIRCCGSIQTYNQCTGRSRFWHSPTIAEPKRGPRFRAK